MTKLKAGALAAAAVLAASSSFVHSAPRTAPLARTDPGGGGVSKADFDRLEGQVQDLQRRVSALEKGGGGHTSGHTGKGHVPHDDWEHE